MSKSKRHSDQVVDLLLDHGYTWDRRNAKALEVYTCDGYPDVAVNPAMPEGVARQVMRRLRRTFGEAEEHSKRKPDQIKARQAVVRDQVAEQVARLEVERAEIIARRDRELDGYAGRFSPEDAAAVARRVEEIDRERIALTALMTSTPSGGDHHGRRRAQHQTGAR